MAKKSPKNKNISGRNKPKFDVGGINPDPNQSTNQWLASMRAPFITPSQQMFPFKMDRGMPDFSGALPQGTYSPVGAPQGTITSGNQTYAPGSYYTGYEGQYDVDPNQFGVQQGPQTKERATELGYEEPENEKPKSSFEALKWNDAVRAGLYGANAFLRKQDTIRNQQNFQNRLRNVFTQQPIWDPNHLWGPDSNQGSQYQSLMRYGQEGMIMAKNGANIRRTASPNFGDVEVEGGEFIQLPDLSTQHVQGPSHAKGGVHTSLPEGTRVFSDYLKPKGSKKTYAQIAKKYDTEKYQKVLDNPYASEPDRKTAQLMFRRNQSILNELFADQQIQNGNSDGTDQAQEAMPQQMQQMQMMGKFGLDLRRGESLSFTDPFEYGGEYLGGTAEFGYGGYYQDGGQFPMMGDNASTFYGNVTYPNYDNNGFYDTMGSPYFQMGGYTAQEGDEQVEMEAEARLKAQEDAAINEGAPVSTNPNAYNDDASFGQNYISDLTPGFPPTSKVEVPQANPMVNQEELAAALDKNMPLTAPREEQETEEEENRPMTFEEFKETQPKNLSNPKLQKLYKDYIAGVYEIETEQETEESEDDYSPLEAFKKAGYLQEGGYYSPEGKKYKIPKGTVVKEEGDKTIKAGDYVKRNDGTVVKVSKIQATRMAKSTSSSKAKDYAEGRLYLQGWSEESPENAAKLKLAEDAIARGIKAGQIKETKPSGWKTGDPTQITILGNFKPSFKERMAISEVVNKTGKGFGTNSYQIVGQKATDGYAKPDQQGNYKGTGSFVGGMTPQDYEQRATYERALAEGMTEQQAEALATTTDSKQQIENRRRYLNEIGYNVDDVPNSVLGKDDFYKSNYTDVTKAIENTFTQAGFRPAIGDDQLSGWEHYDAASYARNPSYANIEVEEPPGEIPPGNTYPRIPPFEQVPSTPGKFQAYQAIPEALGYLSGLSPYSYYTPDYTHTEIAPPTLNIDPELQSINDALQSTIRQSTGNASVDNSRRAALFNQALSAKQNAFARKENYDAQARFQADQYNAQARDLENYRDVTSAANVYNEYMAAAQDAAERERLSAISNLVNKKAGHDAAEYLKMMYFTTMYPQYYYEGTDRRNPIKFNPHAQEFYSKMAKMYPNQVPLDQASQAVPVSGGTPVVTAKGTPLAFDQNGNPLPAPAAPTTGGSFMNPQGYPVTPQSYMWNQPQMNPNINYPNFGPTYNVPNYPAAAPDGAPVIIPEESDWNWNNADELKFGGMIYKKSKNSRNSKNSKKSKK